MNRLSAKVFLGLSLAGGNFLTQAADVTYYYNDFESPNLTPNDNCQTNLDQTYINTMYGTPENPFYQQFTVETVILDDCWDSDVPCAVPYENPDGIGGNYAIGMLRDRQDDKLWLDFTVPAGIPYFNVDLDISSIDVRGCGGPFSPPGQQNPPVYEIKIFDISVAPPVELDSETITGVGAPNQWTYKWNHKQVVFNKGDKTELRMRIDAVVGSAGYVVFDNLRIWGSMEDPTDRTTVGAIDDPHFKTWAGQWYDYMGECDLVLLQAPNFEAKMTLDINIRTKIRYLYSYIESAVVKIGDETFELASFGDYLLNGVANVDKSGMSISGFPIVYSHPLNNVHVFEIQVGDREKIVLKSFKDMVSVKLEEVGSDRFRGSMGMMGSFDKKGAMLGRDGSTILTNPNEFAVEWQVRDDEPMLFQASRGPQHPRACILPDTETMKGRTRRLGESIARNTAEKACAKWSADTREACIYDVMATGDLELAAAGAF